jgi:hypothetical protein
MEVIESYELKNDYESMQTLSKKVFRCNTMVSWDYNHKTGEINENVLAFTPVENGNVKETIDKYMNGETESVMGEVGMWINIYPDNTFTITKEPV